ncbi:MAG: archaeosortase/exosortase family protein [Verrucomicrobiales bacterium]|nr:archaeosortase/exosortase family protein [Verrucomicrobiales bacterium]
MKIFPSQTGEQTAVLARVGKWTLGLGLLFCIPLVRWAEFALTSEFHSHVLLVPFVSWYLIRTCALDGQWQPSRNDRGATGWMLGWSALAVLGGLGYLSSWLRGFPLTGSDALSLSSLSLLCGFYAVVCWHLSVESIRQIQFPLGFLLFLVPLPSFAMDAIEIFLQHASAEMASWLFSLSGLPFLRDQLTFTLPGITLKVAQECSGVRSSLVLFMTSLIAAYLFLRNPNHRWSLAVFTVFLGILRNAFRILVIAWLCVEIGPEMIHSVIHKRGGPLFFALSLVPLGLVLWSLIRRERRQAVSAPAGVAEVTSLVGGGGPAKARRA